LGSLCGFASIGVIGKSLNILKGPDEKHLPVGGLKAGGIIDIVPGFPVKRFPSATAMTK
jgi:hypothetical protein